MQLKRSLGIAAVAIAPLVGSFVAAPTAQADGGACFIYDYSPDTVVMGLTAVVVKVNVETDCDYGWLFASNAGIVADDSDSKDILYVPYSDSEAGDYEVRIHAYDLDDADDVKVYSDGLRLKRRTSIAASGANAFNAYPEGVKKGKALTVRGKLSRVSWSAQAYKPAKGSKVKIQFKKAGTSTYVTQRVVTTTSKGLFSAVFHPKYTGVWRAKYDGTSLSGAATSTGDKITVR